jgi:DNA-3-methyladenine glycosylase I
MATTRVRCPWAGTADPLYLRYHDEEWGAPSHDERHLFEMLVLEGAQAGLSWATILRKRERYREVFAGFDPAAVARFDARKRERLLRDPGIVRNRSKIEAAVGNAKAAMAIRRDEGSLDAFLWSFVGGTPVQNRWRSLDDIPAHTDESKIMSTTLKAHGFRFVGPTICYAFMQAVGMVNDHLVDCFRHAEVAEVAGSG